MNVFKGFGPYIYIYLNLNAIEMLLVIFGDQFLEREIEDKKWATSVPITRSERIIVKIKPDIETRRQHKAL